jgi:hypothetical protein
MPRDDGSPRVAHAAVAVGRDPHDDVGGVHLPPALSACAVASCSRTQVPSRASHDHTISVARLPAPVVWNPPTVSAPGPASGVPASR